MLLGVRTQFKEDIHCTAAAELVYSTTLRLPGECFDDSIDNRGRVVPIIYDDSKATTSNLLCHQAEDYNERSSGIS